MKAVGIVLLFSALAYADDKADFDKHKQHMLKEMDEQISELQTAKSCISSAMDHMAMKACHEAIEKARKHRKAEELDERIHRLQEEKEKLNKKE